MLASLSLLGYSLLLGYYVIKEVEGVWTKLIESREDGILGVAVASRESDNISRTEGNDLFKNRPIRSTAVY